MRRTLSLLGLALLLGLGSRTAAAHEIRPALLEIRESAPGVFDVLFKVPARGDMVLSLRPVLPDRMEIEGPPVVERTPGAVLTRSTYRLTGGAPLQGEVVSIDGLAQTQTDALVRLTLQDGRTRTAILRPSSPVYTFPRPDFEPAAVAVRRGLVRGFTNAFAVLLHLVLVAALLLAGRPKLLFALLPGQGAALALSDLGVPGIYPAIGAALLALAAVFVARAVLVGKDLRFAAPVLLAGTAAGLGAAFALRAAGTAESNLGHALLGHTLGLDAATAILAILLLPFVKRVPPLPTAWALGIAATACGIVALTQPPPESVRPPVSPTVRPASAPSSLPRPKPELDAPVTGFLTVEPYEVRLEVLVRAAILEDIDGPSIPPEAQEQIIRDLLAMRCPVTIDGEPVEPVVERGEFVVLGSYGVLTRDEPVPEERDEALVGLTVAYRCEGLPGEVGLEWTLPFEASVTVIDPDRTSKAALSPAARELRWKNELAGYEVPRIEPVDVVPVRAPVLSLGLAVLALFLLRRRPAIAGICLAVAFVTLPFVRVPIGISKAPNEQEAAGIVNGLLTNVYRSFDLREEQAVYDRLERTVLGDQLEAIYLESRRALELEERGGARGRVDIVDVDRVRSVEKDGDGTWSVDADWLVGGSVSHFGHTHYRQNRYRAVVRIRPDAGTWKITGIEVVEERRLL